MTSSGKLLQNLAKLALLFILLFPFLAIADEISLETKCDPSLPPGKGGCGAPAFAKLILNLTRWLVNISIPLATVGILIGGGYIMFSTGSPEKFRKGVSIIKITITGFSIVLLSFLIVKWVFLALGSDVNNFKINS